MIEPALQTIFGLTRLLLLIFIIIMPLMIALELTRYFGFLDKITGLITPLSRRLGFGTDSIYSLLAGAIFGISYGGGVLISEARKGRIVGDQAFLVAVYLAICHALLEDTLLFVSQGAVWWIVVTARLILATFVTALIAVLLRKKAYEKNR